MEQLDLVGASEVASMLSVSRQRVDALARKRDDFPKPVARISAGRIWRREDIELWVSEQGRLVFSSFRRGVGS